MLIIGEMMSYQSERFLFFETQCSYNKLPALYQKYSLFPAIDVKQRLG